MWLWPLQMLLQINVFLIQTGIIWFAKLTQTSHSETWSMSHPPALVEEFTTYTHSDERNGMFQPSTFHQKFIDSFTLSGSYRVLRHGPVLMDPLHTLVLSDKHWLNLPARATEIHATHASRQYFWICDSPITAAQSWIAMHIFVCTSVTNNDVINTFIEKILNIVDPQTEWVGTQKTAGYGKKTNAVCCMSVYSCLLNYIQRFFLGLYQTVESSAYLEDWSGSVCLALRGEHTISKIACMMRF